MRLSPREQESLLVHQCGFLAQKRLARGVRLNHPEAVALIAAQVGYFLSYKLFCCFFLNNNITYAKLINEWTWRTGILPSCFLLPSQSKVAWKQFIRIASYLVIISVDKIRGCTPKRTNTLGADVFPVFRSLEWFIQKGWTGLVVRFSVISR